MPENYIKFYSDNSSHVLLFTFHETLKTIIIFHFYSILENLKEKSELLEVKFKYINDEIDIRVESLINQIHEMGANLREKVKESEKEAFM